MLRYKELFLKSQSIIADTLEELDVISENLKKCMKELENEIISDENKIIDINNKNESP